MGERSYRTLVRIVFIGAGNVASHLAPAMEACGVGRVCQVYSRSESSAVALCDRLAKATAITDASRIITDADIYVVSLVDHAVGEVLAAVKDAMERCGIRNDALWLHTSGSLPMETLAGMSERYGVFYPLQTFSRRIAVDMAQVPIFIEGSSPETTASIKAMAEAMSRSVHYADGDLRRRMHIAAVFACNFTNYMFTVADDLLKADGLSLDVLYPLIRETMRKAMEGSPAAGQTGPAVRGDRQVVERHASMLPDGLADIYRQLSEAIYKRSLQV